VSLIVFDTSVLVNDLRTGKYEARIQNVPGLVRLSSVVLAELWRGASSARERKLLVRMARNQTVLTPTETNWLESGEILSRMRTDMGFSAEKLRDLQFDVLIALTARSHGAHLITTNRADFESIHRFRKFDLEVWPA
jgi:predicted nucleic acid-binding protein